LPRLAARIARNRELLGLHYPSDSGVGRRLAARSLPILLRCPSLGCGTWPTRRANISSIPGRWRPGDARADQGGVGMLEQIATGPKTLQA
jgi:hypothetical protein